MTTTVEIKTAPSVTVDKGDLIRALTAALQFAEDDLVMPELGAVHVDIHAGALTASTGTSSPSRSPRQPATSTRPRISTPKSCATDITPHTFRPIRATSAAKES